LSSVPPPAAVFAGAGSASLAGAPGTVFSNATGLVLHQFVASLHGTCGTCLQYHTRIAAWWGIPMHPHCQCDQVPVLPGAAAPMEFASYRAIFRAMDEADKRIAIGASNYRLMATGLADWTDIVAPDRVRDFWEVVAIKRLSVALLIAAGFKRFLATAAVRTADQSEEWHAARQERARADSIAAALQAQAGVLAGISVGVPAGPAAMVAAHGAALAD
jgi:hypothetical protein